MLSSAASASTEAELNLALRAEPVDRPFPNAVSIGAMGTLFTLFGLLVAARMGDAPLAGSAAAGGSAAAAGRKIAVHCLDLDGFKAVDDTHGHATGDLLLEAVADRLPAPVRPDDLVARLGGGESVALQSPVADGLAAERLGAFIVEALGRPYRLGALDLRVSASGARGRGRHTLRRPALPAMPSPPGPANMRAMDALLRAS